MALFPTLLFIFYGVPARIDRLRKGEDPLEGILAGSVVLCLVFGAAVLQPDSWIVVSAWLPTVPFVVVLLARERKTLFAAPGMTAVLAFFCGVAFVNGMQETREHILKYKDYNAARVAFLEKHTLAGDAIIFQDSGNMEHAGPLFFDRVFLLLKGPEDRERIARMLHARGVAGIYEWTVNPLGIETYNPYASEKPPAYPLPPWARRCCGGSCEERRYYLVRLETGAACGGS